MEHVTDEAAGGQRISHAGATTESTRRWSFEALLGGLDGSGWQLRRASADTQTERRGPSFRRYHEAGDGAAEYLRPK